MKAVLDTSVLVSGLVEAHARHAATFPWLQKIRNDDVQGVIALHSIAETYAVLSTLPVSPRIAPSAAWVLVEHTILPFVQAVELSAMETQLVVQRLSRQGLAGGVVYDALIAEAAMKAGAECIITLNVSDFRRATQGMSISIREP
ncbi:MAG: PIN domain-containing protein [Spirochaetia bacterium]